MPTTLTLPVELIVRARPHRAGTRAVNAFGRSFRNASKNIFG